MHFQSFNKDCWKVTDRIKIPGYWIYPGKRRPRRHPGLQAIKCCRENISKYINWDMDELVNNIKTVKRQMIAISGFSSQRTVKRSQLPSQKTDSSNKSTSLWGELSVNFPMSTEHQNCPVPSSSILKMLIYVLLANKYLVSTWEETEVYMEGSRRCGKIPAGLHFGKQRYRLRTTVL